MERTLRIQFLSQTLVAYPAQTREDYQDNGLRIEVTSDLIHSVQVTVMHWNI
jgi:hypothetical protein